MIWQVQYNAYKEKTGKLKYWQFHKDMGKYKLQMNEMTKYGVDSCF